MLYILMGIFVLIFVIGIIMDCTNAYSEGSTLIAIGTTLSVIFLIAWMITISCYNSTKSTADKQIAVLEERNELVIKQIEPLVDKYLNYEGSTYKDLKLEANIIVSMANYPQLKGDEFIQSQIKIILDNQKEITNLQLSKAKLNAYKMWIFVGE